MQIIEATILNDIGQHLGTPMRYVEGDPHQVPDTYVWSEAMLVPDHGHDSSPLSGVKGVMDRVPQLAGGAQTYHTEVNNYWIMDDGTKIDFNKSGTGYMSQSGGVPPWEVAEEITRLTGKEGAVLRHQEFRPNDPAPDNSDAHKHKDDDCSYFNSAESLDRQLQDWKSKNQLPIVVCVNARRLRNLTLFRNFKHKLPPDESPISPSDEDHFITIDDYRPAHDGSPAMVLVHDQIGNDGNGWLPVPEFYPATR